MRTGCRPNRAQGLERPKLPTRLQIHRLVLDRLGGAPRVDGSLRDPSLEVLDDVGRQFARGRHLILLIPKRFEDQALLGMLGTKGRPGISPPLQSFFAIEIQAPLELALRGCLLGMAGVTLLDQDRTDLALEKSERLLRVLDHRW